MKERINLDALLLTSSLGGKKPLKITLHSIFIAAPNKTNGRCSGTVLLIIILNGEIRYGEELSLETSDGKFSIYGKVNRIEEKTRSIDYAKEDQKVEICIGIRFSKLKATIKEYSKENELSLEWYTH